MAGIVVSLILAGTPFSHADPVGVWLQGELDADHWVAIRFNVTSDSDFVVHGKITAFNEGQERDGGVLFVVKDGVPRWIRNGPGGVGHNWWIDMHHGHIATPLGRWEIGSDGETEVWGSDFFSIGYPNLRANRSVTIIGIYDMPRAYFTANATWTRGVLSYDVASGPAIIRQADEMRPGVHAGSYNPFVPRAAAGALLTETLHTERDLLGWFLPENNDSSIVSRWSCFENGKECPPRGWGPDSIGLIPLVSKGPTRWDLAIDATLETFPSVVIGGAELPGDDYLVDGD